MITWNNLDTLASFKELEKVERVNLVEAMTGESGAERVKNYSVPMAEGLTYNYAAKQVDDKVLAALAKLERNEEAYHLLNDGDGIDVSDNENPTLWLTIREEDKHIFFEIRDNGAGMTQEKADQILTYQSSGYGVRNVCDRIHVLYGEKGEMKIESTPGKGTRVFIRIPKKTEAKVL